MTPQISERSTSATGWTAACAVFLFWAATALVSEAQIFTKLVDFEGANGAQPLFGSLVQGWDGGFYGTTVYGGIGAGTVFRVTAGGELTTLHSFCSQNNCMDGCCPFAGLASATDGNFYGTTFHGASWGTIFEITSAGTLTTLYFFGNGLDGAETEAGLVQASDGNFYGVATYGGGGPCTGQVSGCGTVFKVTPSGTLTVLHSFSGTDGQAPVAGLIQATDRNFYGTTLSGGANNAGTIFKITPTGTLTTLHSFDTTDGANPVAALVQASDGKFYGTTTSGGADNYGTAFQITRGGKLTTLHSFHVAEGANPSGSLVQATDGSLYGTAASGGKGNCEQGCGTIFKIIPGGALKKVYDFKETDGATPKGGLLQATDGKFYGTTYQGGDLNSDGTVFSLDVGLGPFVAFVRNSGRVGQTGGILGQGFAGTTDVSLNGTPATFTVVSDTFIRATVPAGATTGYVTVTTPSGTLTSNVPFHVIP